MQHHQQSTCTMSLPPVSGHVQSSNVQLLRRPPKHMFQKAGQLLRISIDELHKPTYHDPVILQPAALPPLNKSLARARTENSAAANHGRQNYMMDVPTVPPPVLKKQRTNTAPSILSPRSTSLPLPLHADYAIREPYSAPVFDFLSVSGPDMTFPTTAVDTEETIQMVSSSTLAPLAATDDDLENQLSQQFAQMKSPDWSSRGLGFGSSPKLPFTGPYNTSNSSELSCLFTPPSSSRNLQLVTSPIMSQGMYSNNTIQLPEIHSPLFPTGYRVLANDTDVCENNWVLGNSPRAALYGEENTGQHVPEKNQHSTQQVSYQHQMHSPRPLSSGAMHYHALLPSQ